jgi:hypothetical protein
MIIDKEIEITVNNHNLEYYINKGYNAIYREKLIVKVLDLTIGSHYKINVECDICNSTNIVEYRQLKGKEDYLCNSCASKKKKKVTLTDEQKSIMVEKMLNTKELKKLEDPNYGKRKIKKEKVIKEKIKKEKIKKTQEEIDIIIKKRKKTKLEKYGDENFNNQKKKVNTLIKKYGDGNYNNTEARKKTLKEKYGDENFNNQEKKEITCLNKYGVRHTNQNLETMIKIQKNAFKLKYHENMNFYYRGSYEKDFLDFCFSKNINISLFDDELYYQYNEKTHRYYPDFYHKETNTIIEIKSEYTFQLDYEINLLKEKCSKEKYNFLFIIDKNYTQFINYILV